LIQETVQGGLVDHRASQDSIPLAVWMQVHAIEPFGPLAAKDSFNQDFVFFNGFRG
jgi:hypothetical protein